MTKEISVLLAKLSEKMTEKIWMEQSMKDYFNHSAGIIQCYQDDNFAANNLTSRSCFESEWKGYGWSSVLTLV